jgi:hypothetical protein
MSRQGRDSGEIWKARCLWLCERLVVFDAGWMARWRTTLSWWKSIGAARIALGNGQLLRPKVLLIQALQTNLTLSMTVCVSGGLDLW